MADETESFGDDGLATEGTLVVGFDAEYPPYGYMDDNGDYTGFDLELAEAVCQIEGWELVKTPIDWDSKDMELNSGNIDCIWNTSMFKGHKLFKEKYGTENEEGIKEALWKEVKLINKSMGYSLNPQLF